MDEPELSLALHEPAKGRRLVVQHNALAEATYRLSLRAQKLLIRLIAELDQRCDEFSEVTLQLADFAVLAAQERNDVTFAHFCEAAEQFLGRYVTITPPLVEGELQPRQISCHWISSIEKNPNNKTISFSFDPKLKPYLLRLKRCFFAYRTLYAFNLNSVYAIRLYQWAKSREYLKRPHPVSVDELRCFLGTIECDRHGKVVKESLKRYADLKRVSLKPAMAEVNAKTDLFLSLRERKKPGTKIVTDLIFTIRQKEEPPASARCVPVSVDRQGELALAEPVAGAPGEASETVLDRVRTAFGLNPEQIGTVERFIRDKGLDYVREKLTLTEAERRENVARFFLAALHRDFKAAVRYEPPKPRKPAFPRPPVESRELTEEERQAVVKQLQALREALRAGSAEVQS